MRWSELSMTEKNEVIKMAVAQGIKDIPSIKNLYEESVNGSRRFEDGGGLSSLPSNWTMQDEAKYRNWRENLPVNLRNTNDNDYDMRRAYLAGMQPSLEDDGYYHLGSRDPKTGRILKAPHHPTYLQAINTDARIGYYPTIDKQGVTYTNTWKGNKYGNGGSIHIDPSKKGTFTAAASRHGKSVQEFASQVLAHKENYSPAMVKKANFARNAKHWKHEDGGNLFDDGGFLDKVTEALEGIPSPEEVAKRTSAGVMQYARQVYNGANANPFTHNWMPELDDDTHTGGIAQRTYLLPRSWQEKEFLNNGYIKGKEGDYGLVKKAVGNRELPIYQTAQDAISRDQLIPLGNIDNMWYGDKRSELEHPGSYPTAVYTDGQGNFYQKAWDLNDYGGENGSTTSILGKVADFIGSPVVVTTGFQKIDKDRWNTGVILKDMMSKKGLVPTEIDGKTYWTLPEVTVVGKRKKHGLGGNLFEGVQSIWKNTGD